MSYKAPKTLATKTVAALTTAYASGWELDVDTQGRRVVCLYFDYAYTDATSWEFKVSYSLDGTSYYDLVKADLTMDVAEQTDTDAATRAIVVELDTSAAGRVKIHAKRTGGTGGTLACTAQGIL